MSPPSTGWSSETPTQGRHRLTGPQIPPPTLCAPPGQPLPSQSSADLLNTWRGPSLHHHPDRDPEAGRGEKHFLSPEGTTGLTQLCCPSPVEVDPELEPESAEYLVALERATAALEQCVNLCKAHVMMVTCFDISVTTPAATPGPQEVDV